MQRRSTSLASFLGTLAVARAAAAEPPAPTESDRVEAELRSTMTAGLTDSVGWPSQDEGTKAAVGFAMRGTFFLVRGDLRGESQGDVEAAVGPAGEEHGLAKARDDVSVDSTWSYLLTSWFGISATAGLQLSPLGSRLDHATARVHTIERADGATEAVSRATLGMTDPGLPLRLQQEAGVLLLPVDVDPARVAITAGPAARETFADDQLAIDDDPSTDAIELVELASAARAGAGGAIEIGGVLRTARIRYRLRADVLAPFAHRALAAGDDGDVTSLTDIALRAEISLRITSWASVDYGFQAMNEPLVIDDFRVRSALSLSVGPTLSYASRGDRPEARARGRAPEDGSR